MLPNCPHDGFFTVLKFTFTGLDLGFAFLQFEFQLLSRLSDTGVMFLPQDRAHGSASVQETLLFSG